MWCRTALRNIQVVYPGALRGVDVDPTNQASTKNACFQRVRVLGVIRRECRTSLSANRGAGMPWPMSVSAALTRRWDAHRGSSVRHWRYSGCRHGRWRESRHAARKIRLITCDLVGLGPKVPAAGRRADWDTLCVETAGVVSMAGVCHRSGRAQDDLEPRKLLAARFAEAGILLEDLRRLGMEAGPR